MPYKWSFGSSLYYNFYFYYVILFALHSKHDSSKLIVPRCFSFWNIHMYTFFLFHQHLRVSANIYILILFNKFWIIRTRHTTTDVFLLCHKYWISLWVTITPLGKNLHGMEWKFNHTDIHIMIMDHISYFSIVTSYNYHMKYKHK